MTQGDAPRRRTGPQPPDSADVLIPEQRGPRDRQPCWTAPMRWPTSIATGGSPASPLRYPSDTSVAHVWIDVFETAEGAAGWVTDTAGDIVKQTGGSHQPRIDLASAAEYPLDIGEGPNGLILTPRRTAPGPRPSPCSTSGGSPCSPRSSAHDDGDARVPVQYLAEETADRILDVLLGTDRPVAGHRAPHLLRLHLRAHRRDRQTTAGSPSQLAPWTARTSSAQVTIEQPDLARSDRSWSWSDGLLWARRRHRRIRARGHRRCARPATPRSVPGLAHRPPTAGLTGALEPEPATHDIGGVTALGYRGSAARPRTAIGLDLRLGHRRGVQRVGGRGSAWVIELDLTLTGDAGSLTQLIGAGFPDGGSATVTDLPEHQRHRLGGPRHPSRLTTASP